MTFTAVGWEGPQLAWAIEAPAVGARVGVWTVSGV